MSERIVKRTGDVEKRSKAQQALTEVGFLRKNYKENKKVSDGLSDVWEMERKKTEQCKVVLDKMREQLILAQEDIDADYLPEGAQPPPRIAKRDKLQLQVTQLEAALEAQKRVTSRAFVACNEAERKLFESDRNLHQYVDSLEDAELAVATQAELDHDRAERLARLEAQRAMRWEGEQKQALDARAAQIRELAQLATTQLTTAKASHVEAVERVKTHTVKVKQVVEKIQAIKDEHLADRTQAVLQLKADQNAVRSEVATQAAKHNKKLADDKRQLESEKASMLAKGLNPYVEFRRRAFAAEGKAREKRMKNAVEDNKASLAERLIKEEGERRKEEAAELKAKEYEKKHRDEQGRHVIEERNKNYITSVMSGGTEVLDPSGRAPRVDPSQVTDVRDHSFGLGIKAHSRIPAESMKRITEKIRRDLQIDKDDLGEYAHLVKGLLSPEAKAAAAASSGTVRSMSASSATRGDEGVGATTLAAATTAGGKTTLSKEAKEAERAALLMERKAAELRSLANKTGTMPGADNAGIELNFAGSEEEKAALLKIATEEAGGESVSAGDLESLEEPKYPAVVWSKFEKDSFLHAKERQRNRLEQGTEQVAGGRVFRGQSFVPKPAELIFKDFEVGKKYKKIFTLTNASYTFNSFKILDLEDTYIDFFVITFERPGRMSAGVSCSIEIVFTPQLRQDIFTNIRFLTETGPIEVPLKCLIKRCAPRITTTEIDFGKMVLGQKALLPVKITNSQALGTTFTIARYGADEESVAAAAASAMAAIEEAQGGSTSRQLSPRPGTEGVGGPSNSQKTSPRLSSPRAAYDMEAGAGMGTEVASCEAELDARVKRTMTEVLRRKQRENPFPLSMQASMGEVDGYGNTSLQVVCAPLAIGKVEQNFTITFDGVKDTDGTEDDLGKPVMRHQTFSVRVKGYDLPIFLADETVNMMCTLHGRTYRKRLELRNRAKTAYRVNINIPPPFNKYIEVSPNMCFVQGSASQFINIKFVPKEDLITKLAHYCVPYEAFTNTALVSLPIEIQVVNQELPVYFILRSEITPSTLNLSSQQLDFGKVYVNQQSTLTLTVTNSSMLPQKIAFVKLKKEMSVKPNDGFAALLPNECMSFEISFCPLSAVNYDLDLILMSSFNDTYTLKVSAEGVETPFEFSTSVISMRTTGPGERVVASTMIQNKSLKQQCLEIIAPDARFTWLRVAPTIVDLAPLAFARVEFEFLPPREALSLDPKEWHKDLVESVSAELGLSVASEKGGGGGGVEQGSVSTVSPLDTWTEEAGWVFAKGMYGEIQWVKAGAGIPSPVEASNVVVEENAEIATSNEEKQEVTGNEAGPETDNGESAASPVATSVSNTLVDADVPKDLPSNEWGICGKWRIPICIKQRARSAAGLSRAQSRGASNDAGPPLFMCVETMVMLPQLEVEPKILDFGQLAIGTRMLKTIKVVNLTSETIKLRTDGINACGPFCLIAPPRPLGPGEMRSITVQCLPERPGLTIETLELSNSDASIGGHQLRIPLRAQGLKPSIELKGLSKPPPSWSPRSGILDFGNVIAMDKSTLKFSILNNSSFAVDAGITRTSCKGLSPSQAAQLIERTASGLPVIAYRPERVLIQPGDTAVVEVTFNPDRGRFAPFREEFDVTVGQTDEVLRVGVCGRSWNRQVFVLPSNPADEAFSKIFSPGGSGVAPVEDLLNSHPSFEVRKIAQDTKVGLNLALPSVPPLKLEFPDPFAPNADPSSYVEAGAAAAVAPAKGGKGAPAPAAGAAGTRQQQRKILIACAKVLDGRAGAGNATFEIQLSPEAKNSGLFQLSTDKGAVNAGSETPVEIVCTLPKPKGIGGLTVGSWQTFLCNVVVKGGWIAQGETDEECIPLLLKAFVSL